MLKIYIGLVCVAIFVLTATGGYSAYAHRDPAVPFDLSDLINAVVVGGYRAAIAIEQPPDLIVAEVPADRPRLTQRIPPLILSSPLAAARLTARRERPQSPTWQGGSTDWTIYSNASEVLAGL